MLLVVLAFAAATAYVSAQQKNDKDVYGLWQYVEERVAPDGTVQYIGKPIFKSIKLLYKLIPPYKMGDCV